MYDHGGCNDCSQMIDYGNNIQARNGTNSQFLRRKFVLKTGLFLVILGKPKEAERFHAKSYSKNHEKWAVLIVGQFYRQIV